MIILTILITLAYSVSVIITFNEIDKAISIYGPFYAVEFTNAQKILVAILVAIPIVNLAMAYLLYTRRMK
jgi:hypothetical protein